MYTYFTLHADWLLSSVLLR